MEIAKPRVAVIGAGGIGRGWATLIAGRGWPVTLFDASSATSDSARTEVTQRVQQLLQLELTTASAVEDGLAAFTSGRSLLQAVTDADWIIDAGPDELGPRQRLLEQVEQVCRMAAIITSSSQRHHASALCARLRRPDRLLCVNPMPPVEYMPVVEVIPGPLTDPGCVSDIRFWLRRLGHLPVVLQAEIPGNVSGRLAAAVWRECVHLVLEGVISVEDLDRAISGGPALAWAAAGPHLKQMLAAGDRDLNMSMSTLLGTYEEWWQSLSNRRSLDGEEQHRVVRAIEQAYPAQVPALRQQRNRRLAALLTASRTP